MKPILLNGTWRSGTTFLYNEILREYGVCFCEPLNNRLGSLLLSTKNKKINLEIHSYFDKDKQLKLFSPYLEVFGDKIIDIILKYHPNIGSNKIIYNIEKLEKYLLFFKGYSIKEVLLHFYLFEDFIQKNWDVYHIIRDPFNVYESIENSFLKSLKKYKIILNRRIFTLLLNSLKLNYIYMPARQIAFIFLNSNIRFKKIESMLFEETFLITWIVSNHYVISRLDKDKLLIYNKPETLKKLPFEVKGFKPKILEDVKEKYQYKFEKIAKEWELSEEYEELMKLFD